MKPTKRLTEERLARYAELDAKEKAIHEEKESIRQAIIADGRDVIQMGRMVAMVSEAERLTARPREEIIEEIGEKACSRIMRKVRFHKVSVRKR